MRVSAKADYACRALLELALHWPHQEPLHIGDIAKRQNIPLKFLTQILIALKQLDLVESVRGKQGGYVLTKNPAEISLCSVIKGFGGFEFPKINKNSAQRYQVMNDVWEDLEKTVLDKLEETTLANLCLKTRGQPPTVIFNI